MGRFGPGNGDVLDDLSPGYLEFDEEGNVQVDKGALTDQARQVTSTIWKALDQQLKRPAVSKD